MTIIGEYLRWIGLSKLVEGIRRDLGWFFLPAPRLGAQIQMFGLDQRSIFINLVFCSRFFFLHRDPFKNDFIRSVCGDHTGIYETSRIFQISLGISIVEDRRIGGIPHSQKKGRKTKEFI